MKGLPTKRAERLALPVEQRKQIVKEAKRRLKGFAMAILRDTRTGEAINPKRREKRAARKQRVIAGAEYVPTRADRRKKKRTPKAIAAAKKHAGSLKHRGERMPMRNTLPPYERPSRVPDKKGKRPAKKRGLLRRKPWKT